MLTKRPSPDSIVLIMSTPTPLRYTNHRDSGLCNKELAKWLKQFSRPEEIEKAEPGLNVRPWGRDPAEDNLIAYAVFDNSIRPTIRVDGFLVGGKFDPTKWRITASDYAV